MTKLALIGAVCAAALSVAGCATTGGTTPTITTAQVVADAQAVATALCAVAPTASAITGIITAQNAGAQASEQQAQAAAAVFCGAVNATAATPKSFRKLRGSTGRTVLDFGTVVVNGVPVEMQGVPAK